MFKVDIYPSIKLALVKNNEEYFAIKKRDEEYSRVEINQSISNSIYLSKDQPISYDIDSYEGIVGILNKHVTEYEGLTLFLDGMNSDYDEGIRKESIELLMEYHFNIPGVHLFIKKQILDKQIPDGFDPKIALEITKKYEKLNELYQILSRY